MERFKRNILGGKIYKEKSPEERKKEISEQELQARLQKEALNDAEKRS